MINANYSPFITLSPSGGVPTAINEAMRVTVGTIAGLPSLIAADNTVRGLGVAQQDMGVNTASGASIALYTFAPGTRRGILTAGPVTYGNTLYAAAAGAVAPTGTVVCGVSLTTSANVSDIVEYLAASAIT